MLSTLFRWPLLVLILAVPFTNCSSASRQHANSAGASSAAIPQDLLEKILGMEAEEFQVERVLREELVIRVDILLKSRPGNEADAERQAMDALSSIQALTGKEDHLAVWTYFGDPPSPQGMAFYSSLTERYNFTSAGELE